MRKAEAVGGARLEHSTVTNLTLARYFSINPDIMSTTEEFTVFVATTPASSVEGSSKLHLPIF